ncbi:glycosyltransferase [Psychroserpens mesophilus]|uniref:glycosyltransferase n=1 Tax=Psychroserpens mesophilus TaxID=325473 RepID=UPI00058C1827|nr:glycosyltransferase family 2 protein [Psychroserpens mesophilus]
MNFYIVIPAHNEEDSIGLTLESLAEQTLLPKKVIVVNDHSTDKTVSIIQKYVNQHHWLNLVNTSSSNEHIPGSKVINAFYKGYEILDENYDIICKFDADIILPKDYLENIKLLFETDKSIGIAGGLAYIKRNGAWVYENISNKNHVRGPFKAYRKLCFEQIGGLKTSIGWDTVDTLLAKYHGWKVVTDKTLHIKHLKPTGFSYNTSSKYLQGEALYKMRYGFTITLITALKMALKKRSFNIFINYMNGYFKAKRSNLEYLVTEDEGKFIRNLRWNGIFEKFK